MSSTPGLLLSSEPGRRTDSPDADIVLSIPPPYVGGPWLGAGLPLISASLGVAGLKSRIVRLLDFPYTIPDDISKACDLSCLTDRPLDERIAEMAGLARLHAEFFEGMLAVLLAGPERIFGFSAYRINAPLVLELARQIKERRPDSFVIIGGPEAIETPGNLRCDAVDVIIGRNADALAPLAVAACRDGRVQELAVFAEVWVNPRIKQPYHLMKRTIESPPMPSIDYADIAPLHFDAPDPEIPVLLNVGCPFHCGFCPNTTIYPKMEWSTPKRLFKEIDQIVGLWDAHREKTGATGTLNLFLCDATMNAQPAQFEELCELIIQAKWKTRPHFRGNVVIDGRTTPTRVKRMADAGFDWLFFGLESGSDRVRREIKKPGTIADVARGLQNIRDHAGGRLRIAMGVVIGWPSETEEEFGETVSFLEWLATLDIVARASISPLMVQDGAMDADLLARAEGRGLVWRMPGAPAGSPAVRIRRLLTVAQHFARLPPPVFSVVSPVPLTQIELMLTGRSVEFFHIWAGARHKEQAEIDKTTYVEIANPSPTADGRRENPEPAKPRPVAAAAQPIPSSNFRCFVETLLGPRLGVGADVVGWKLTSIIGAKDESDAVVLEFHSADGTQTMALELKPKNERAPAFKRTASLNVSYLKEFGSKTCSLDPKVVEFVLATVARGEMETMGATKKSA